LASRADGSDSASTLPRPELNPLLNPLLADNMGRWAEVYFTSAPEKREEAVLELLRELEAQQANHQGSSTIVRATPAVPGENTSPSYKNTPAESTPTDLRPCETCGHANLVTHQFCGMCGAQLAGMASEYPRTNEAKDSQPRSEGAEAPSYAEFNDDYREVVEEQPVRGEEEMRTDPYDLSLFQSLREKEYAADLEEDQSPSVHYRYYIAAVLAILIVTLGYMAWSGSRSNQSAQGAPPPPPPAATENTTRSANQKSADSAPANPSKSTEPQGTVAEKSATPAPATRTAETSRQGAANASMTTPPASALPANPQSPSDPLQNLAGSGAGELAMAQRYLIGSSGQARDPAEAAKWLWKSVAKHNGPAVLLLADLYLKGDGVSKNCDQARVLLDSAARSGMAGAGERLRNLQAFGCQ